ncbi:MAG: TatD family hydrolase [Gemmatimonadota bacterium]|nr:TatD family hydrolase [Gemmatimonadota bacterium]
MLVDTHCHLGSKKFDTDRALVVENARTGGVGHVVVVADAVESTRLAVKIAKKFNLSATAGVHPHEAKTWDDSTEDFLRASLSLEEVVAVGEAGLDYHYDFSPRHKQQDVFRRQLALGSQFGLPVVIHSRSADDDMVSALRETDAGYVLHSFSSGPKLLRQGLDDGAYISFSGMITFKSWDDLEAVRAVPLDRVLIETDAPYLAPVPFRGKRNEPAFVAKVAERLAEIRDESLEEIETATTENALRCFGPRINLQPS